MSRTRVQEEHKPRTPTDPTAWARLAQRAADQAMQVEDKREHSIRYALGQGQAESVLRALGIICEADILREFCSAKM